MSGGPGEVIPGFLDEVWDRGRADAAGGYVPPSYEVPGLLEVHDGLLVRGRFLADVPGPRKALGIIPADLR